MDKKALDALRPYSPEEIHKAKGQTEVWIGLTRDCPLDRHRIGPICIQRETHQVVRDEDGTPIVDGSGLSKVRYVDGKVERLTGPALRHIVSRAMKIVVRVTDLPDREMVDGSVKKGLRRAVAIKTYSPEAQYSPRTTDRPISDFVYILPTEDYGKYGGKRRPPTITTNGEVTLPEFLGLGEPEPKKRGPGRPRKTERTTDTAAAASSP